MDDKDNSKRDVSQIKRMSKHKVVVVDTDSDAILKMPLKKKSKTGVLPYQNNPRNINIPKVEGIQ